MFFFVKHTTLFLSTPFGFGLFYALFVCSFFLFIRTGGEVLVCLGRPERNGMT